VVPGSGIRDDGDYPNNWTLCEAIDVEGAEIFPALST
jgi:hypothetical protein